jgi:antitoxin component of MazEF toxin-antitoxin module
MTVKTRILHIGSSRWIRVPKALLDHAQLPDRVELVVEPGCLIVRAKRPRSGWAEAAKAIRERGDDRLL